MEKKQLPTITLSIDTKKYQEMADRELDKNAREAINERLSFLFINPATDQNRYDYLKRTTGNNPDLAAGHTFIKDIIDKKLLGEEFQKYVEGYIERNWTRILDDALEKALSHKANGIAFRAAKGKLNLKGEAMEN